MKRWLVVALVVVLAGGGWWFLSHRSSTTTATQYLTSTVKQGDVTASIAATGSVGSATTYSLAFGQTTQTSDTGTSSSQGASAASSSSGNGSTSTTKTVATVPVDVGQHVAKGQVLATEDASGAAADVASARASVTSAQAQVQVARSNLVSTQAKIRAQTSASTQVAAAQAQLAADQAQLTVDQQRLATANAQLAKDQAAQPPAAAGVIAADTLAVAQAKQAVARDNSAIASDTAAITSAKDTAVTSSANAAQLAQSRAAVTQAQNQVTTAQAQLRTAVAAAATTTITAPVAGVITAVNVTVGQSPPSSSAITMRSDSLTVVVDVAEQDVANLKVGQAAKVTITALSQTVPATITALPTAANSSSGSAAVTFPLSLALTENPAGILPGMTASIAIVTATAANVLYVPSTAIQGTSPSNSVQLMVDGAPQSVPVDIGLSTNSSTEIISGVQAGQTVVTGVVNPTAATTTPGGVGGLTGRTGIGGNNFPGGARPGG